MGSSRIPLLLLAAALSFVATGCEETPEAANSPEAMNATASVRPSAEEDAAARLEALRKENEELKQRLASYERSAEDRVAAAATAWKEKHPRIAPFAAPREWTSAAVVSDDPDDPGASISDPSLLRALGDALIVQGPADYTNGAQSDIDPFSLRLTDSSGTYLVKMVNRESVEFPELAPGQWFKVSPETANFGKAWMARPDYEPDESLAGRLLDSGMLVVKQGDSSAVFLNTFRVRRMAIEFLTADKKEIEAAEGKREAPELTADFYLYGHAVSMDVYEDRIDVRDGGKTSAYEVGGEVGSQMAAFLAAG